jgi:hypothetical protein
MSDSLLGALVRDNQTGYEGIATARIDFHTGCSHYIVEATQLKADGSLTSSYQFDPERLEVLEESDWDHPVEEPTIELWVTVCDAITGFTGFVSALKTSLFGPPQICIEPDRCNPDGELNMPEWFFQSRVGVESSTKEASASAAHETPVSLLRPDDDWAAPFGRDEEGVPRAPFGFRPNGDVFIPKRTRATADLEAPWGCDPDGKPYAPYGYLRWPNESVIKLANGGPSPYGGGISGVR